MLASSLLVGSAQEFASANFSALNLKDVRRTRRVREFAREMALNPGFSIPKLMPGWSDTKSVYRMLAHKEATPDSLQAEHRRKVRFAMKDAPAGSAFLLIEDTSEIDYSGRDPVEGLGPVGPGTKGRQGFHLHSVVAVRVPQEGVSLAEEGGHAPLDLLGFVHQEYYIRKPKPKGEKESYQSQKRERESELFLRSTEAMGKAPDGVEYWRIVDRAGDMFLTLSNYHIYGHQFVVRALHNRCLEEELPKLFDHARSLEPFEGEMTVHLRAAPGRAARDARVRLAAAPVTLSVPHLPRQAREQLGKPLAALACTIVRVFEENPPEPRGESSKPATKMEKDRKPSERVEWFLLTSAPVTTLGLAREVAARYASRWNIEEFHRALKEGVGAERLQLESKNALFAAVAIMCVVALRLVALKERVRLVPDAPASQAGLSELEMRVLAHETKRQLKTVRDVALAVGRLGGHLNRKSDGMPGYRSLMQGFQRLATMVKGAEIAMILRKKGGA